MNRGFWFAVTLMGSRAPSRVTCIQERPPRVCWVGAGWGVGQAQRPGHRTAAESPPGCFWYRVTEANAREQRGPLGRRCRSASGR